jgi:purine-nucleoside phosphorylase
MTTDRVALESAVDIVRTRWPAARPRAGLILGSGWGEVARAFDVRAEMPYAQVPNLGNPGVASHAGRLAWAVCGGGETLIFQGRRHLYEGSGGLPVMLPVYLMKRLGVTTVVLTNAAGGIRPGLRAGDLMPITDHINGMGANPLTGPHDPVWGPRFPDQTRIYRPELLAMLGRAGAAAGGLVEPGVYLAVSGPTYETPAEIRAFRIMGADAVGMSTVPEAILANAAGLRVAGVSCISNLAAGIGPSPLSHEDVEAAARAAMPRMQALLKAFWEELGREESGRTPIG